MPPGLHPRPKKSSIGLGRRHSAAHHTSILTRSSPKGLMAGRPPNERISKTTGRRLILKSIQRVTYEMGWFSRRPSVRLRHILKFERGTIGSSGLVSTGNRQSATSIVPVRWAMTRFCWFLTPNPVTSLYSPWCSGCRPPN